MVGVSDTEPRYNGFKLSKNVWMHDIECPCCRMVSVHPGIVEVYELINARWPHRWTSWCRCKAKDDSLYLNKPEAKRYVVSGHTKGTAYDADRRFPDDKEAKEFLKRIGVSFVKYGPGFTHIEIDRGYFRTAHY